MGHHFARPGNRFWPTLHRAGFTPRQLSPFEDAELLTFGCGITNLAPRPTTAAAELTPEELSAGARTTAQHRALESYFSDLAAKYKLTLIPFLLEGVGGDTRYMQRDGLHPNAEGSRRVAALVLKTLNPLLAH